MLTEGFKWIIDTVKSGSNVSFYHIYWFWWFLTDDCYTFRKDYFIILDMDCLIFHERQLVFIDMGC